MPNSNPGFFPDQVPSVAEWDSYFTAKVDAASGIMTGGTIDSTEIGLKTPAAAAFTAARVDAVITGPLNVLSKIANLARSNNPRVNPVMTNPPTITSSGTINAALTNQTKWSDSNVSVMNFYGGPMTADGIGYAKFPTVTTGGVVIPVTWRVQTIVDAIKVEYQLYNLGSGALRFIVDGHYVQTAVTTTAAGNIFVTLDFNSAGGRATRDVTMEAFGCDFYSMSVLPTEGLAKPAGKPLRLAVVGDSYVYGNGATTPLTGFAPTLADLLGMCDFRNNGVGGTGLLATASSTQLTIRQRISDLVAAAPLDLVVVHVGHNDTASSGAALQAEAVAYHTAFRAESTLANTPLIFAGVNGGNSSQAATQAVETAIAAAVTAVNHHLTFFVANENAPDGADIVGTGAVGATTGVGNADVYISTDTVHPNDAGHAVIARTLADRIMRSVLMTPASNVSAAVAMPRGVFPAPAFGGIWDATHDVGAAINLAIAAANAAGGGDVLVPGGDFGVSTPILQPYSGVRLIGQGLGIPRDTVTPTKYLAVTRLLWIGAAGATMCTVSSAGNQMYSADVEGIVFDCANLAADGLIVSHVSYSTFKVAAAEPRSIGIQFTTQAISDGPGNQHNDVWAYCRSTSPSNTYSPTGILIDQGVGSSFNTSYNRFHELSVWYAQGDGIVVAGSDNNIFYDVSHYRNPTNGSGRGCVFASSTYVPPNGVAVNGSAYDSVLLHGGPVFDVQGSQSGSSIVAGVHVGTAAVATVSVTTNGTTAARNATLNFAATTGVVAGMSINTAGGSQTGIMPNSIVSSVTSTTVVMAQGAIGAVATSQAVVFGYGLTSTAVAGTYTVTAVDGTHWSITAPAGGNSQSNIAITGAVMIFTDLILPLTGTPTASDTFIVTVPTSAKNIQIQNLDRANNDPDPIFEPGANGWVTTTQNPYPEAFGGTGNVYLNGSGTTNGAFTGGGRGSLAQGVASATMGGFGCIITGSGSAGIGHNARAPASYSWAGGDTCLSDGFSSRAFGANSTTRGRYLGDVWGAGQFAAAGDAQFFLQPLSAATTDGTLTRLTADRLAAGAANTMNLVPNSTYRIALEVVAHQTGGSSGTHNDSASWTAVVLLKQGANAAATAFVGGYYMAITTLANTAVVAGTGFTATLCDAAANAWTITLNADTTNGGLLISGTGAANKNIEWLARATSVEVVN